MGRKILLVTTDQQRYDTLGCNGGTLARTPVVDASGRRGDPVRPGPPPVGGVHAVALDHPHRPAPEHPRGVDERGPAPPRRALGGRGAARRRATGPPWWARPTSSPSSTPSSASPRTPSAAIGTEPPGGRHRGFEHLEMATHGAIGPLHYARWLAAEHPEAAGRLLPGHRRLAAGQRGRGRDTGAPQVKVNPDRSRDLPHRLGGRPHHRLAGRAWTRPRTGSAG